jgi:hypothetical protein
MYVSQNPLIMVHIEKANMLARVGVLEAIP